MSANRAIAHLSGGHKRNFLCLVEAVASRLDAACSLCPDGNTTTTPVEVIARRGVAVRATGSAGAATAGFALPRTTARGVAEVRCPDDEPPTARCAPDVLAAEEASPDGRWLRVRVADETAPAAR